MASTPRKALGEKDVNTSLLPSKRTLVEPTGLDRTKNIKFFGAWDLRNEQSPTPTKVLRCHHGDSTLHVMPRKRSSEDAYSGDANELRSTGNEPKKPRTDTTASLNDPTERLLSVEASSANVLSVESEDFREKWLASPFDVKNNVTDDKSGGSNVEDVQTSQETQGSLPSGSSIVVDSTPELSNAELLQTRLRLAMFKVRTEQTHASFSELEALVPVSPPKERLIIKDPPSKIMRRYRRMIQHTKTRPEKRNSVGLLPAFEPTHDINWGDTPTSYEGEHVIDPRLESPGAEKSQHARKGGSVESKNQTEIPDRLDSRQDSHSYSDEEHGKDFHLESQVRGGRVHRVMNCDRDLTSSAVKGRAADCLLQLGLRRP